MMNEDKIIQLQEEINKAENVPDKAFRRDYPLYKLVCYLNIASGCYVSGNYKVALIFIENAREYMQENQNKKSQPYYSLVSEYLSSIEAVIKIKETEK